MKSPFPALVVFFSLAQAQPSLDGLISNDLPSWTGIYRQLHANPELSYEEKNTSVLIAQKLQSYGYAVTQRFGKYDDPKKISYGVVAVLKNGAGPTLMIRTDMDALPVQEKTGLPYASAAGIMHACGHDLHMSVFLGTAQILVRLKGMWRGTLVLVGQPAEEMGAGAEALLDGGLYRRFPAPDYAIALHSNAELPAGMVASRAGYMMATADTVDILVRGKGGHGAYPHLAKDPVILAAQLVLSLQEIVSREKSPLEPVVITVGSVRGGSKPNVIPDEVRLQLSVRSYAPEVRAATISAIRRRAQGLSEAAGIPKELAPIVKVDDDPTPALYNDPALTGRLVETLKRSLGPDNVLEAKPSMAAEDFARYGLQARRVPISLFWLGAVDPDKVAQSEQTGKALPALHSSEFAPLPEPAIRTGVKALTSCALELLKSNPGRN